MNSWNFNELTQKDALDFKACQRQDQTIYGVPDKSDCVQGKELKAEDLNKIAQKANSGDAKAKAQLDQVKKVQAEQKTKAKEEKAKAAAEKKKKEQAAAEKKGGKGKKGGGKGKKGGKGGGKGKKGGKGGGKGGGKDAKGKAAKPAAKADDPKAKAARRKEAIGRARETVSKLQEMLRKTTDPKSRQLIQTAMSDLLKSVVEAARNDAGGDKLPTPKASVVSPEKKDEKE